MTPEQIEQALTEAGWQSDGSWRFVIDNPWGSAHGF